MTTVAAGILTAGPSVSAQSVDDPSIPGEGLAAADTIGVSMKTGGLASGINLGRSVAGFTEGQATARADALDLGALLPQLYGEAAACAGQTPLLGKDVLPPKTLVDSQDAGSDVSHRVQAFLPDGGGGLSTVSAGFQDATATSQPAAQALTDTPSQDVSFFQLVDPHTRVSVSRINGVREAKAVMYADKLTIMGGLIVLRQPRWEAVARSGAAKGNVGSFTFSGATVLGFDRSFDQATADVQNFANSLHDMLSNLGIYLDYPTVTTIEGGVKVSPMQFRITDMPLGITGLGPFFAQLQPLREKLFEDLNKDCVNRSGLQFLDLILQVLSGSGNVLIPVGGVEASTKPTVFPAAIIPTDGSGAFAPPPAVATPPASDQVPVDVAPDVTSRGDVAPSLDLTEPTTTVEDILPEVTEAVPTTTRAVKKATTPTEVAAPVVAKSTKPTSKSTTVALGIIALVGALGLMVGDQVVMRRSRRRIIQ